MAFLWKHILNFKKHWSTVHIVPTGFIFDQKIQNQTCDQNPQSPVSFCTTPEACMNDQSCKRVSLRVQAREGNSIVKVCMKIQFQAWLALDKRVMWRNQPPAKWKANVWAERTDSHFYWLEAPHEREPPISLLSQPHASADRFPLCGSFKIQASFINEGIWMQKRSERSAPIFSGFYKVYKLLIQRL